MPKFKYREIRTHRPPKAQGLNKQIRLYAIGDPGPCGAHTTYEAVINGTQTTGDSLQVIEFQKGPAAENGVNGTTNETLLAILIDRFEGYQRGAFACP